MPLAEAHRALGQLEQAVASCRVALQLRPHYPEAANNLGMALLNQGKTDDAMAAFALALRLKPDFTMACNNLGNAQRLRGDLQEAETHFRRAVAMDPALAEANSNLGQLLLERHQPHESLRPAWHNLWKDVADQLKHAQGKAAPHNLEDPHKS
jgi:Flp pilus assembly protein TadD